MTALSVLAVDVAAAMLICPVLAVVVSSRRATLFAIAAAAAWVVTSMALFLAVRIGVREMVVAHVVVVAAALASASLGRWLRATFDDPLDATAVSVVLCLLLSVGVFAMGRFAGELPPAWLNAVLAVNPLVATAAAANIDIVRSEMVYRTSPLAHLLFSYPAWQLSAGLFALTAAVAGGLSRWTSRRAVAARS